MLLQNKDIIEYYEQIIEAFNNTSQYLPAKINFIINKNVLLLKNLTNEIYIMRDNIVKHYGEQIGDLEFEISDSQARQKAQLELDELLTVEQTVTILKIKIKDIENLNFTFNQMQAIMFMIEENNDEDQVE